MKKISMQLEYNNKVYVSDCDEYNEGEEIALIDLVTRVMQGKLATITFSSGNITRFFPEEIVAKSILSLVYS